MRPLFDDILKVQGKWLRVFVGKEVSEDPYEKNTTVANTNPLPIKAIVEDLTAAQAQWKVPGIVIAKIKEVTFDSRHKKLIEQSTKIEFDGEFYEGWRANGKMQIREVPGPDKRGYLRLYIYTKAV